MPSKLFVGEVIDNEAMPFGKAKITENPTSWRSLTEGGNAIANQVVQPILVAVGFEISLRKIVEHLAQLDSSGPSQIERIGEGYPDLASILGGTDSHPFGARTETNVDVDWPSPKNLAEEIRQQHSKLEVHPCLLETLETIAAILRQKPNPESSLGISVLEVVVKWRGHGLSAPILRSQYSLAIALRDRQPQEDLVDAIKKLEEVLRGRTVLLGATHPDTLTVKRELLVAIDTQVPLTDPTAIQWLIDLVDTTYGQSSHETLANTSKGSTNIWDKIQQAARDILVLQEEMLGELHPETLRTLLWIFFLQSDLEDGQSQAHSTADVIAKRLRVSTVRSQRPFEATSMENNLALIYEGCGKEDAAAEIRK
ncbi:hypothetical protein VPNG_05012 [Cytospora leucostoma]|uniref:Uncharacterized protein n=1 Tax=Cytospora leucostoma TaxID=1230097 RepID=A0A423X7P9_9PEZI|nr:hypothetical protein VPNG_05012 [Cytospora leucostoma]